ncbi:MAG: right-handed parallel beta-helix repeat-containing protein, partial [Candidatus Zixiibacteriota bacterium]
VVNCLIVKNKTDQWTSGNGGGVFALGDGGDAPHFTNNTIFLNDVYQSGQGAGLYLASCNPIITNCIIYYNKNQTSQIDVGIDLAGSENPRVTYCDVPEYPAIDHNIYEHPLFDEQVQYHLSSTSPCVDKGDQGAASLPSTDFEGDDRMIDGNGDLVAEPDMGWDEYEP